MPKTMKFVLALFVVSVLAAQVSEVAAVQCSATSKCQKTKFTIDQCVTSQCKCKSDYTPTEEGCIKIPVKPTLTQDKTYNREVISGNVAFTCETNVVGAKFKWQKDGNIDSNKKDQTATFALTPENLDLKIRCAVVYRGVESEMSDLVTIKALKSSDTSDAEPVLTIFPPNVGEGKEFQVLCTKSPFGAVVKIEEVADSVSPSTIKTAVTFSRDNVGKKRFRCTFSGTEITFSKSPKEIAYPEEVSQATFSAQVMIGNQPVPQTAAYTLNDAPVLTCQVSPDETKLEKVVMYTWTRAGARTDTVTKTFQLDKTKSDTYKDITCTAKTEVGKPSTQIEATSKNKVTIVVTNDYLTEPTLVATSTEPLPGSKLALKCDTREPGVQFMWWKGENKILDQEDNIIQYGEISAEVNGKYKCGITKYGFLRESTEVEVNVADAMKKPTVQIRDVTGNEFGLNGDMEFLCNSDHASTSLTYKWAREGNPISSQTDSSYKIKKVTNADAGKYSCTTSFKLLTQTSSDFELKVVAPGQTCVTDANCAKTKGNNLSGVCDKTIQRCDCAPNFVRKGNGCETPGTTCVTDADCAKTKGNNLSGVCDKTIKRCDCAPNFVRKGNGCQIPGKTCETNADCTQIKENNLSGVCDGTAKRCNCAPNFVRKGNGCENGVAQMAASVLVVMMAALMSRLL